jgi:protein arginine kinase activator
MDGLGSILSGLMGLETMWNTSAHPQTLVKKCPVCGMTKQEISNSGKLGCAECYITFIDDLRPLLRKIHGNCLHHGSVPEEGNSRVELSSDNEATGKMADVSKPTVETLKIQMHEAIKREDFETAAAIRDRIKAMQTEEDKKEGK